MPKKSKKSGSQHNDKLFKEVVTGGLRRQHTAGLAQGAYAMCKVVLDLAVKEGRTPEERLASVVEFCSKCINPSTLVDGASETSEGQA